MPIRSAGVIHNGNPGPCVNRNRGRHGAVSAPMHGYRSEFLPTAPYQCQLVRGRPHLRPTIAPQQQGDEYQQHQDDIASHAAPPLIVCAVPSADREGGQPCADVISSFPAPHNALSGSTRVPGTVGPRGRSWARSAEAVSQGARGEFGGAGRPQGDAIRNIKGLCLVGKRRTLYEI